ncbi:hypothetical protein T07_2546 [Trichinella nelsoni]|uniref:Uncharacterized protein n=1 Tax=Trichinella nelsoni TaxID=6336 RepID=A0A0V0RCV3_9BILA|nr:hypothetical protein T07_2546 [Trichinella nelsoni]
MPYYVCSTAEEQTCLDNNVLGRRTALYTLHGSICEKPLRSINSVASQYVHSVKASGRSERPSESSESSTVLYTVVLQ